MIQIDKDIPIPPPGRAKNHYPYGTLKAALSALEKGWSFIYPIRDGIHREAKSLNIKVKVKPDTGGFRVWRIE
jgi:hypothetical protein